jgi:Na+/proline symporter
VPGGAREIAGAVFQAGQSAQSEVIAAASGPPGHFFQAIIDFFAIPMPAIGIFIGMTVCRLATYTSDQVMIQRFQTTRNVREARRGFLVTAASDITWMTALTLVGVALFAYLRYHPLPEAIANSPDRIFPYFMSQVFPVGVTGLVIAAIMAASLGSIAGAVNSLSAVVMVDFYGRMWRGKAVQKEETSAEEARREVFVSRLVTLAMGAIGITLACNVASLGSIIEISNKIINSFTGPLLGVFLLGMFTRRANTPGVFCGGFVGTVVTLVTIHLSNLHVVSFLWPSVFGLAATLVVGYASSFVLGRRGAGHDELTFQVVMQQPEPSTEAEPLAS